MVFTRKWITFHSSKSWIRSGEFLLVLACESDDVGKCEMCLHVGVGYGISFTLFSAYIYGLRVREGITFAFLC